MRHGCAISVAFGERFGLASRRDRAVTYTAAVAIGGAHFTHDGGDLALQFDDPAYSFPGPSIITFTREF